MKKFMKIIILIVFFGCIIFLGVKYKFDLLNNVNSFFHMCKGKIDLTLFYTILICMGALLGILVCWIIAKKIDKKRETRVKRPLAEVHPRLNMLIVVFWLIIMIVWAWALVYYLFEYLAKIVSGLVDWIIGIASKLDAVVIVALITGAVSIGSVIISSIVSKVIDYRKNRQDYLSKKREDPYGQFVNMVYKLQQNAKNKNQYTEEEMIVDISKFSKQITLWGSSGVVNKWVKFRENGTNPEAGVDNLFLLEEIMNVMRKDLGMEKVKKGNLLAFFVNDIKRAMKTKS